MQKEPFLHAVVASLSHIAENEFFFFLGRQLEVKNGVRQIIGRVGHVELVFAHTVMFEIRFERSDGPLDPFLSTHPAVDQCGKGANVARQESADCTPAQFGR